VTKGVYQHKPLSLDTRLKMRASKIKKPTNYWLGKKRPPYSKEWRQKISDTLKGRKKTDEHRLNMSKARIAYLKSINK
jgi:hypothetical protein